MSSRILVAAAALALSAVAGAHHSPAMLYDLAGHIEVEGVVTQYSLGNPHMRIYLDVDNGGPDVDFVQGSCGELPGVF